MGGDGRQGGQQQDYVEGGSAGAGEQTAFTEASTQAAATLSDQLQSFSKEDWNQAFSFAQTAGRSVLEGMGSLTGFRLPELTLTGMRAPDAPVENRPTPEVPPGGPAESSQPGQPSYLLGQILKHDGKTYTSIEDSLTTQSDASGNRVDSAFGGEMKDMMSEDLQGTDGSRDTVDGYLGSINDLAADSKYHFQRSPESDSEVVVTDKESGKIIGRFNLELPEAPKELPKSESSAGGATGSTTPSNTGQHIQSLKDHILEGQAEKGTPSSQGTAPSTPRVPPSAAMQEELRRRIHLLTS